MKTLSYYKQLRESYACIIPKTAPAYELIEALDVLIASLQPDETQPHFLGVPVNLPKGWLFSVDDINHVRLTDCYGDVRATVYATIQGDFNVVWGDKYITHTETQREAIKLLNDKANNDAAS